METLILAVEDTKKRMQPEPKKDNSFKTNVTEEGKTRLSDKTKQEADKVKIFKVSSLWFCWSLL